MPALWSPLLRALLPPVPQAPGLSAPMPALWSPLPRALLLPAPQAPWPAPWPWPVPWPPARFSKPECFKWSQVQGGLPRTPWWHSIWAWGFGFSFCLVVQCTWEERSHFSGSSLKPCSTSARASHHQHRQWTFEHQWTKTPTPHYRCKERTNWNFRRSFTIKWLTVFFTMQYNKKNLLLSFPVNIGSWFVSCVGRRVEKVLGNS